MLRILKPGGTILSFDTRYKNPENPNTKPVRKRELQSYFKNCHLTFYPTLLMPQMARIISNFSVSLCFLLERIPFLRSHYLTVIRRSPRT
ncbi:MAG: hypothetical protein A3J52_02195 [Omnitrophica bacterium RIFCSPHIGHO2_02_FULL_49_9]|nr:MAG: hypothetical protein A3J52_02195 [Omnitrophica bacterium RIFCSPHIGHO2_02_FULL_49_9]